MEQGLHRAADGVLFIHLHISGESMTDPRNETVQAYFDSTAKGEKIVFQGNVFKVYAAVLIDRNNHDPSDIGGSTQPSTAYDFLIRE